MLDAIEQFIRWLATERGLSENYQLSVRRSLESFAKWLREKKNIENLPGISQDLITEYLTARKRGGLAAASIKLELAAIKIFLRHLHNVHDLDADVGEALTLPRVERYLPETLNEVQIETLIDSMPNQPDNPLNLRDRAMLELFYASGLRISEVTGARL